MTAMPEITLDKAVLDLAERAGQRARTLDDGARLEFTADLEICYEITHSDGSYHLHVISRGERGIPNVSSPELSQIEKHLTYVFGRQVRQALRLPALPRIGGLPGGFSLHTLPGYRHVLTWTDDDTTHEATFSSHTSAVIFACYARASRPDVEASMLSPDGSPVF
ncbi:MAG: hypothetical protein GEV12_19095 [Micromonosporaceae bacterium]|nr:hypothetical protein [Micromonosporaceae bacterium]